MRTWVCAFLFLIGASACAVPPAWSEENPRQRVVVELREYAFSPSEIFLQAGTETELVLVNRGTVMHEFESSYFQELDVAIQGKKALIETLGVAEIEVEPGGEVVLRFTPETTGEFPVACHAIQPRDHFEHGMGGLLVVK